MADCQTTTATAAPKQDVLVSPAGVLAAVGLADESQLLQPDVCSGQRFDQAEAGPGAAGTGPSNQTKQSTPNRECEDRQDSEKGSTR